MILPKRYAHRLGNSLKRAGHTWLRTLGASLLGVMLASCAGDMSDLHQFVQQTKAQRKGAVRPLPEFEPYQNFVYDASQLRDPFVAKTDVLFDDQDQPVSANGISPNRSRRREPLESYPLDTLKMVGVLEQNEVTWGLIQAPDETIHRVLAGNYAGQNYGEITSISEEKISVYEIIPDGQDGWTEREAALVLGDE